MPEQAYMVIDERADHSIRIPRPDLTRRIGTPNACNMAGCHTDQTVAWAVTKYEEWYGRARKPHYGTILAAGRQGRPEARDGLIRLAGDELYPAMVRATALSLLNAYPSQESARAVARALADSDPLVRYTAVSQATAADARGYVALLAPLLFDPVGSVRMLVASQLATAPDDLFEPYQREARRTALAEYMTAMEYSLDFAFGGFNLGNLSAGLGDQAQAETYYRRALAVDDLFVPAKVNLAILLNGQGRNDEAEQLLREALDAEPQMHDIAYSLGLLLAEMGRYEEAERYLARAVPGMPDHPRAARNLQQVREYLDSVGR
jgi:tetratricopeptide (TPR) repeat protein